MRERLNTIDGEPEDAEGAHDRRGHALHSLKRGYEALKGIDGWLLIARNLDFNFVIGHCLFAFHFFDDWAFDVVGAAMLAAVALAHGGLEREGAGKREGESVFPGPAIFRE